MVGGRPAGPAFQVGERDGDDELAGQAGVVGQLANSEQPPAGFLEGVVEALGGGAGVFAEPIASSGRLAASGVRMVSQIA